MGGVRRRVSKPELLHPGVEPLSSRHAEQVRPRAGSPFRAWRDPLRRRLLALADVAALIVGGLSLGLATGSDVERTVWAVVILPIWLVFAKLYGLYDRDHTALRHLTVDELPSIFFWTLTATVGTALILGATPAGQLSSTEALRLGISTAVAAFVFRAFARFVWRRLTPPERVFVLGSGPLADAARRKLELFPDIHATPVDDPAVGVSEALQQPELLLGLGIDRIIVASDSINEQLIAQLVAMCRLNRIKLSVVPPAQGMFGTAVRLAHVADLPMLEYNTWDLPRSTLFLKRCLDLAVSFTALLVLAPLFLVIALMIFLDSPGTVVFSQIRVGMDGRLFRMRKFRTMVRDAEARLGEVVTLGALSEPMFKIRNDPRVTRVGRLLRRTSLDELPQLFNVLMGDMSLVGPRPEQVELVDLYTADQSFRLAVKPGLTGPMQVYGRGELTFEERLAVERDYIENLSLGRDVRILAMTLPAVLGGRGAF